MSSDQTTIQRRCWSSVVLCSFGILLFFGIWHSTRVRFKKDNITKRETLDHNQRGGPKADSIRETQKPTNPHHHHHHSNGKNRKRVRRVPDSRTNPFHKDFVCSGDTKESYRAIVGGVVPEPFSQPWVAYIRTMFPGADKKYTCTGTVISDEWVLSAAHCFIDGGFYADSAWILMGFGGRFVTHNNAEIVESIPKQNIIIHERFESQRLLNDIALIRLHFPIPKGQSIRHACLPFPANSISGTNRPALGDKCIASGWDQEKNGLLTNSRLNTLDLYLVDCEHYEETHVCAAKGHNVSEVQDICAGDSGGPLIWKSASGTPTVIGILSSGSEHCDGAVPSLYTKVAKHIRWIRSVIEMSVPDKAAGSMDGYTYYYHVKLCTSSGGI